MSPRLKYFLPPSLKKKIWPILFWSWMIWVSFWIDRTRFAEPVSTFASQSYSNFSFSTMSFEQRYTDGTYIHVTAQDAKYDDTTNTLDLTFPQLTYKNEKQQKTKIEAKGDKGVIQTAGTEQSSGLPSELVEMVLIGNVYAEGKDKEWSANANKLTFKEKDRKVYFPNDEKKIQIGQRVLNSSAEMIYDLRTEKLEMPKKLN